METDFRIRYSILVELADCGIIIPRTPQAQRKKIGTSDNSGGVFGLPLETVIERRGTYVGKLRIPEALMQMAAILRKGLSTEGLFRINGSAARMKAIQAEVDAGGAIGGMIHDVAGMLKLFLRLLPNPLLTHRLYEPLISAVQIQDEMLRLKCIQLLLLELNSAHLHTCMYLMQLLRDVVSSPGTRMTAGNLAAIFTPNIMRPSGQHDSTFTSELELANHQKAVSVVELLIIHSDQIGVLPLDLVRKANELDEEKAKAQYVKMVTDKPRSWWIFGKRDVAEDKRKTPKRQESLSSDETLDLIHKGHTARPKRNSSQKSESSDQLPPASAFAIPTEPVQPTKTFKASNDAEKENKTVVVDASATPTQRSSVDDPPISTFHVAKDVPGFDSFMMY